MLIFFPKIVQINFPVLLNYNSDYKRRSVREVLLSRLTRVGRQSKTQL